MPERTSYVQGTPSWVDLSTTDQDAAKAFYSGLFGWEYQDTPMDEEAVYSTAQLDGKAVAAIASQPPDQAAQDVPPMWNTYLAVDDVDTVADRIEPAGGTLMMPPFDVMEHGRMTFAFDPAGAAVGFWQAKAHIGAQLVNEPGTMTWNELRTSDRAAGAAFLTAVLGVETEESDMGGQAYTLIQADGELVGGITDPPMPDVPNYWDVAFATADIEASVARATELGGTVVAGPLDIPIGRVAQVLDPQGATFSLFEPGGGPDADS